MKQSELLRKQADMMDMAEKYGITKWSSLVRYRCKNSLFGIWCGKEEAEGFYSQNDYQFALGVVEGRPVFEGDELYPINFSGKVKVIGINKFDTKYFDVINDKGDTVQLMCLTWNPPKPKTIMVELPIETAEWYAKNTYLNTYQPHYVAEACRKSLGELK